MAGDKINNDYTLRWMLRGWVWGVLLVAAVLHYIMSVAIWWIVLVRWEVTGDDLPRALWEALPAGVLLLLSLSSLVLFFISKFAAFKRMLVIVYAASVLFCAADVICDRHQISVCLASQEYWDKGGARRHYFTWWWLNDRYVGRK